MNILEARNITKKYGQIVALEEFSLEIPRNTILGLIGPNGSGKTTFVNLITGFSKTNEGDIFINGERINGCHPHEISRLGVARTFQETRTFRNMTVIENLLVASRDSRHTDSLDRAHHLLTLVGLLDQAHEYCGTLSYGQQKLVELVRALMSDPSLILLDEPAAGINPVLIEDLLKSFRILRDQGKTIIIVEHNMDVVRAVCESVVVMHHGRKIAEGTPAEVYENAMVRDAYFGRD